MAHAPERLRANPLRMQMHGSIGAAREQTAHRGGLTCRGRRRPTLVLLVAAVMNSGGWNDDGMALLMNTAFCCVQARADLVPMNHNPGKQAGRILARCQCGAPVRARTRAQLPALNANANVGCRGGPSQLGSCDRPPAQARSSQPSQSPPSAPCPWCRRRR